MSHMFCTRQEAARTLNASEDQIQALLDRGLLQEFREGQHCLLKEADVGALARRQRQRRPARAGARSPQSPGPRGTAGRRQPYERGISGYPEVPPANGRSAGRGRPEATGPRRPDRRPADRLSVPQWFWMGLVQDRPVAIALLSGLVLAFAAALVAGLCFLAQAA
jgi:hypothetical protein